jgi:hypothetical protein
MCLLKAQLFMLIKEIVMDRKHFGLSQAYHLMHWLSEAHPQIFKEWVAVQDVIHKANKPDESNDDKELTESEG